MKKAKGIVFTLGELRHLMAVLVDNERSGEYWGNYAQFLKRHQNIVHELPRH